jgi:hypothetical protein
MRKRKLRLAVALPVTQLIIAAILLSWGHRLKSGLGPHPAIFYVPTVTLVCYGISAPALLLRAALLPLSQIRFSVASLDAADLLFLSGVVVVWYFVGKAVDRRIHGLHSRPATVPDVVGNLLAVVVSIILFALAVAGFGSGVLENPFGSTVEAILSMLWSLILIVWSGANIFEVWRHRRVGSVRPHSQT